MNKSAKFERVIRAVAVCISVLLCGTAFGKKAATPPNSPPPLTEIEQHVGIPGVQFSNVIEASGQPVVTQGAIREGEALLTIPYAYRYTAVVTEDVKGFSFTVGGVQAPAGSPGYYAGTFVVSGRFAVPQDGPPMDLWCFFPRVAGGKREHICLLRNFPNLAAIAPTRMNPDLWTQFSPMTGTFDYVRTPIFKRQPVTLPVKPMLEYRFSGWAGDAAKFRLLTLGGFVQEQRISPDPNGIIRLRTVGGDFLVAKDVADPTTVRISPAK
jgi:hypothetical protein